jgi:hypothetical protein
VILLEKEADPGRRGEDPRVQQRLQLGADRNELPARDAKKGRGLGLGQDALRAKTLDSSDDVGIQIGRILSPFESPEGPGAGSGAVSRTARQGS